MAVSEVFRKLKVPWVLSWALGAPALLHIFIRNTEQVLAGVDMSRAHGTPPSIPHQSYLNVTDLKKFIFPQLVS